MTPAVAGAALGALAGVGVLLLLAWDRARRPRLASRLEPYLRPSAEARTPGPDRPRGPTLLRVASPALDDLARRLSRWGPGTSELRRRLDRAAISTTPEVYRSEQAAWTVSGVAAGLVVAGGLVVGRGASPVAGLVLVSATGLTAYAARDLLLARAITRRETRISEELPGIAELLALAVAAGEGPLGALDRVIRTSRGELSRELGRVVADVRAGAPLARALDDLADRSGVPALTRFAEALATAVERGTPLADVLRAQAQDVREAGRRRLMEDGGRREVAMLVPVVLLILPVTVVFAILPGLAALRLGP